MAYDNIQKIAAGQGGDYTTSCLLDYPYFKKSYKFIDSNEQEALDADPKAVELSNFTKDENTKIFFIIKKAQEIILDFSQGSVRVL